MGTVVRKSSHEGREHARTEAEVLRSTARKSAHHQLTNMADNAKYITVTDDSFEQDVLNSDVPVLVDFWATWCGPCRAIAPTIEQLAEEFEGKARIAKLDTDHNPKTAMNYNVRSIPSLIFFKDGMPVDQLIGVVPKNVLADKLEALAGQEA